MTAIITNASMWPSGSPATRPGRWWVLMAAVARSRAVRQGNDGVNRIGPRRGRRSHSAVQVDIMLSPQAQRLLVTVIGTVVVTKSVHSGWSRASDRSQQTPSRTPGRRSPESDSTKMSAPGPAAGLRT